MADVVSVEEVANAMYKMVEESQGQKKLKPTDLTKAMFEIYEGRTDKKTCKAAIKAGDRLSPEEITALLEQRHLVADPHHCPHGRPTALVFTREELDMYKWGMVVHDQGTGEFRQVCVHVFRRQFYLNPA